MRMRLELAIVVAATLAVAAVGTATAGGTESDDPSEKLLPDEQKQEIDWEAADDYRHLEVAVSERLWDAYDTSPVPVLLPDRAGALESLQPTVGQNWYAANLVVEGRDVTIQGDRVARVTDDFELPKEGREQTDDGFLVTQTDGVLTISFTAFNAAYSVDVECASVDSSGTCTDESFAMELANDLGILGGRR